MDKLKDFIELNKEAFDQVELPEGHLNRFEQKLRPRPQRPVRPYLFLVAAVAACLILLFLFKPAPDPVLEADWEDDCKIEEVQLYYAMRMNEILSAMEDKSESSTSPGVKQLIAASQSIVADCQRFEEELLPTMACSEDVFFVMNQQYENSLTGLQFLLDKMESLN